MSYVDKNFKAIEAALNTLHSEQRKLVERMMNLEQALRANSEELVRLQVKLNKAIHGV